MQRKRFSRILKRLKKYMLNCEFKYESNQELIFIAALILRICSLYHESPYQETVHNHLA